MDPRGDPQEETLLSELPIRIPQETLLSKLLKVPLVETELLKSVS